MEFLCSKAELSCSKVDFLCSKVELLGYLLLLMGHDRGETDHAGVMHAFGGARPFGVRMSFVSSRDEILLLESLLVSG